MASARVVALALLMIAGSVAPVRAQAPSASASPECVAEFAALRSAVEKKGMAAKAGADSRVSRQELCKLVTAYSAAETKWVKYVETNMSRCGIPESVVSQLQTVHARTAEGQRKLCAVGFSPGDLREMNPDYRFGLPTQPNDLPAKTLPRISGR